MAIDFKDTFSLMQAVERMKTPASFLLDTFFPQVPAVATSKKIAVETRKRGRTLAPFVSRGASGVNVKRAGSKIALYEAPMMGPRTVIDPEQLDQRAFAENIVSTMTPAQRAAQMQAEDLSYLQGTIINRKNKMAADLLTTGKCKIEGYADDGETVQVDEIDFEFEQDITPTTTWDQAGADIYGDLKMASEKIQENAGIVPTVLVVGKNVEKYILDNASINKMLAIPNRENMSMFSFAPEYLSPQVRYVGRIISLNIDVYAYLETYQDDEGKVKSFIGDDAAVLGVPGRGRQQHAAVTLLNDDNQFTTYAGIYVPYYYANKATQELTLSVYSRCVLIPETIDDWATIKTK